MDSVGSKNGKPFNTEDTLERRGKAGRAWKEAGRKKSTFPHFLIRLTSRTTYQRERGSWHHSEPPELTLIAVRSGIRMSKGEDDAMETSYVTGVDGAYRITGSRVSLDSVV